MTKASAASHGIIMLGTNAISAIPELTRLINDKDRPVTSKRAIITLSKMGAMGLPPLLAAMQNPTTPNRSTIIRTTAYFTAPAIGTNTCMPLFYQGLHDTDPQVRADTIRILEGIAPDVLTNPSAK